MDYAYYALEDDVYFPRRWYLTRLRDRAGVELDSREFRYGQRVDLGPPIRARSWKDGAPVEAEPPLQVLLDRTRPGAPLDFTFTNAEMPVVTLRVARILDSVAGNDIQRVPVSVESHGDDYAVINVTRVIDCIDTVHSEIEWYKCDNAVRPDKAGKPEMITKLVIDPARAAGGRVFRLSGWEITIVVSQLVKDAIEDAGITGAKFRKVSP